MGTIFVLLGIALFAWVLGRAVPRLRAIAAKSAALVAALVAASSCLLVVEPGQVAVERLFGAVQERVHPEGLALVNPFSRFERLSVRRESIDFTPNGGDARSVVAVSADRNALSIDASFPYQLAPALAWKLYQRIGGFEAVETTLILPAARAAIRDAVARFGWAEASVDRRADFARAIQGDLERSVRDDLARLGLTEAEARGAVAFSPVLLREIRPDEKVLNAISEKVAAEEDLKKQRILTEIARQEAERRANEGLGVSRLFAELPPGFTPDQIRSVLAALADKQRADALMKAVEAGRVNVMVLPGSTPVSIAVP